MMPPGYGGGVMVGRGYAIFDTAIGRCGIVWSNAGVLCVQLPEMREIDTRRRLFKLYPEAREQRPPLNAEIAIEAIVAQLRGQYREVADIALDVDGISPFNRRAYAYIRSIPRGETRTYDEVAAALRMSGATHSVAQAVAKNPYLIIVPCHRVVETGHYAAPKSTFGGTISKRHLLSLEGTRPVIGKTLFDVLLPVVPPRPHN
jgi:methylated-DNA-[protein]-cysteine S-methyltransferase